LGKKISSLVSLPEVGKAMTQLGPLLDYTRTGGGDWARWAVPRRKEKKGSGPVENSTL
jgi:hypothetical protein